MLYESKLHKISEPSAYDIWDEKKEMNGLKENILNLLIS